MIILSIQPCFRAEVIIVSKMTSFDTRKYVQISNDTKNIFSFSYALIYLSPVKNSNTNYLNVMILS